MVGIQLVLLSHVLTDFVFQWDNLVKLKGEKNIKGFLYHGGILFAIQFIFLITIYNVRSAFCFTLLIVLSHLLIDYAKESIQSQESVQSNNPIAHLFLLIGDQLLHIIVIYLIFNKLPFIENTSLVDMIISQFHLQVDSVSINQMLIGLIVLLYLSFGGAVFIRLIIDIIYRKVPRYMDMIAADDLQPNDPIKEVKVGKFVGILERTILFILLSKGDFSAVGFIIAAKSLARFKQLEKKNFAEYYLIGTFLSFLLTLIAVLLFQQLIIISI
ncbi:Protein of unknown function [Anaerovirgula multivorans]|uniref:DUF3307 domain-containing protein n=1 Tax=Anaerovirgula multivorans TaxID=312168 RepID=A0A239K274_9FIRM|nr:DUF3307 domain-containing protein [Anaerovirgula multivorans]SNT12175.1 Protein of unknown function [Anaerovirgula multivorans]